MLTIRHTILATCALCLSVAAQAQLPRGDYLPEAVEQRLAKMPLHPIEGIWMWTTDGATIAIERENSSSTIHQPLTRYRMVIMRSPSRSVMPGTIMGNVDITAKPGVYTATIFTDSDGGSRLLKPKKFTLTLIDENSRFTIEPQGFRLSLRPWRMVPYLSRLGISISDNTPTDLNGCVRLYPQDLSVKPLTPIYL